MGNIAIQDALFTYATEGILVVDQTGDIIKVNPSAERLLGYQANELINKKIEVLIPERFAANHLNHRASYGNKPKPRSMGIGMDLHARRKDGSEFPVEISLSPFHQGKDTYVIAFIIDVTPRKAAEEKLRNYSKELEKQVKNRTLILEEAIEELEKTKRELQVALEKEKDLGELKSRFVSTASHEFRTPLATILSSTSLIDKYGQMEAYEKQKDHVTRIKKAITGLTDILEEFLSLSKLEEGKITNEPNDINVTTILEDCIGQVHALLKTGQTINLGGDANTVIRLDAKLLRVVILNLLSNAIKFSPADSQIQLMVIKDETNLKISLSDAGIGIPKADQRHLFGRFFRGQNANAISGTGLGLNIVAKYMELMHGQVEFISEENKGTTFTLIFKP